ncbi:MAG: desulfoferrodoxin family protein [Candidatus Omnitrophota bacterium]
MDTFVCGICGYLAFKQSPEVCPVCNSPRSQFQLNTNTVRQAASVEDLTELERDMERKHLPDIAVNKQCGLVGDDCIDVNIKIGDMLHVMEYQHYIMHIDIYIDNNFTARYHLSREKVNPVINIHLKKAYGKLSVVERCNVHGRWMTEQVLR